MDSEVRRRHQFVIWAKYLFLDNKAHNNNNNNNNVTSHG